MDLTFTDKQKEFQAKARELAKSDIAPMAGAVDTGKAKVYDRFGQLAGAGLMGVIVPEEFGGQGADMICHSTATEEIGAACASTALSAHMSGFLTPLPFLMFGSEDQKKKFLPKLCSAEMIGSFALTEPGGGSDAAGLKTTAEKKNDSYILNGTKAYVGNGPSADVAVVFARTGGADSGAKGISAFAIEKGTAGCKIGNEIELMSVRGVAMSELLLENCEVPAENLIGNENEGFKIAMKALEPARVSLAALATGIARAAMEAAIERVEGRFAFGKLIGAFQEVNHKVAMMKANIEVARELVLYAAWLYDQGENCGTDAAIAKLFASEIAGKCADDCVQVHGGAGITVGTAAERIFRDARMCEIAEGTSEIMRKIIAKDVLKD